MKKDLINSLVKLPNEIRYFSKEKQTEYNFVLKVGYKNCNLYIKYEIDNHTNWSNEIFKPTDVEFFMCDYLMYLSRITNDGELEFVIKFITEKIQDWEKRTDFRIFYD